ncbi:50S ribosomal protein L23 [Candidatus Peregrinibacteria bacterium]|nr:50S ribosomal protein L23 [Candidatus Peregrinibacteria bacterium]
MLKFDFILRPVITEKATLASEKGKYQFFVRKNTTKVDIKNAFEKLYGVKAVKVNIINTAGKTKTGKTRRPTIKKAEFKKVIVSTKGKKTIDIAKPKLRNL